MNDFYTKITYEDLHYKNVQHFERFVFKKLLRKILFAHSVCHFISSKTPRLRLSALYSLLHALYIVRGYPFTLLFTFWGDFLTQVTIQLEVISSRGAKLVSFRIFSTT